MMDNERWTKVCMEDDVPFLEGRRVAVGGFYVGAFNTEEGFYDVCPHRGGPLPDGDVASTTVTCPLHARQIDLKTGGLLKDDSLSCTFTFPVKVRDGSVYLDTRALASLGAATTPA